MRWLLLVLLISTANAQITGYWEDFNDGVLSGWEMPNPDTFFLSEADGQLKIEYHRTASSWEWDNFNYRPPQNIDISGRPVISLQAKSNVRTTLTFKPIYSDDRHDWLQVVLPADQIWHSYTFQLTTSGSTILNRIYMYLDGGSTEPKSGIVYFDDLRIGDTVTNPKMIELQSAIAAATALLQNSQEGEEEGQFPPGSKSILGDAIAKAEAIKSSSAATYAQIDAAVCDLYDACATFETRVQITNPGLNDPQATMKTKYLYQNLKKLVGNGLIFGMHDATGYGVGWSNDDDRSDIKDVCGDYPGLYSWDMNHVDANDPVDMQHFIYRIRAAHQRGGVNTLCWHQRDPKYSQFYSDRISERGWYNVVRSLLPGGEFHSFYRDRLRNIAKFLKSLRDDDGYAIPIIFRPYHEHLGAWFWWGGGRCSPQEFNQLWQFTQTFLRDSLNVHNLIYAFSPSDFYNRNEYLRIYPGDDYVDIFGMDYYFTTPSSPSQFAQLIRIPAQLAIERNKVAAVTEVGEECLPTANWFTGHLLPPFKKDSVTAHLVYAAVWRNANTNHFFAPYPGHATVPDFIKFYKDPYTLFEKDLPNMFAPEESDIYPPKFITFPADYDTVTATCFTVTLVTNERAYLRYGEQEVDYYTMPNEFSEGQGTFEHRTMLCGEQGKHYCYFIRAIDLNGNVSPALRYCFVVDTLKRKVLWNDLRYRSEHWHTAKAPLGYDDEGNATHIAKVKTAYFRKKFVLEQIPNALGFLIKCHDGAVAYVNGMELGRTNIPAGIEIEPKTPALSTTKSSKIFVFNQEALRILRLGENIIAAEVHTADVPSPDMSFDGRLFNQNQFFIDLGEEWQYYDSDEAPSPQILGDILAEVTSITDGVESRVLLRQNQPNPFNAETKICYYLPHADVVALQIFDINGRVVSTLFKGSQQAGSHEIRFDGHSLPSGIYWYRLQVGSFSRVKRMILLR